MPQTGLLSPSNRRLATYSYLRPLVAGRRVVEIGCGNGEGAAHLLALGATSVVGVDDHASVERARALQRQQGLSFVAAGDAPEGVGRCDVVLVPDGDALLRARSTLPLASLKRLLGPTGRLVCIATNGDRTGASAGVGYYDLVEALEPSFERVRMFGLTPFLAFGLAEFEETPGGLRVDSGMVDEAGQEPTHYVAVAGPSEDGAESFGYALVQVLLDDSGGAPADLTPVAPAPTEDVAVLRRRLAEVQGAHEGVVRVSRAQAEEIEELRGRLRRGAEGRASLDEEVTRLRRALTEADESVLNLTRRTTEEMAALAQRITSGLRIGGEEGGAARKGKDPREPKDPQVALIAEELRRRELELAARESALSDRDDRIAALEAERQDLEWRLQEAQEELQVATRGARTPGPSTDPAELRRLTSRVQELERALVDARRAPAVQAATPAVASSGSGREQELRAQLRTREQTIEQFQVAAVAHVEETTRLRGELAEQSTLVAELEDAIEAMNARLAATEQEAARQRRQVQEAEEQDRSRRSRLAELEGTLLRLQRQAQQPSSSSNGQSTHEAAEAERRLAAAAGELRALEARLADSERQRHDVERRLAEATSASSRDVASALAEVERLRAALQSSEEHLWEAKGQLLIDRERITVLEHQLADAQAAIQASHGGPAQGSTRTVSEAVHRSILETVFRELSSIENALRLEIVEVSALEREIAEWRAAVAASESRVRLSP